MKKALVIIAIILGAIVAFVLVAGLIMSRDYHFEKSINIKAAQAKVWTNVSTLKGMDAWSPWSKMDSAMTITYQGTDGTEGAVYSWSGNEKVGKGKQSITEVVAPNFISTHIQFIEPFESQAEAYIKLAAIDSLNTTVTWGLDSKFPYPMNVMQLFMNMDTQMDKDYGLGLSNLKAMCEKQ